MPATRDRNLNVRVSTQEMEMLAAVAEADGLNTSDWIRTTIHRAHRQLQRDLRAAARAASKP